MLQYKCVDVGVWFDEVDEAVLLKQPPLFPRQRQRQLSAQGGEEVKPESCQSCSMADCNSSTFEEIKLYPNGCL
jgi:hypothetical protein